MQGPSRLSSLRRGPEHQPERSSKPCPLEEVQPQSWGSSVSSAVLTRWQGLNKSTLTLGNTRGSLEPGRGGGGWGGREGNAWCFLPGGNGTGSWRPARAVLRG